MRNFLVCLVVCFAWGASLAAGDGRSPEAVNLAPNPQFHQGDAAPAGWKLVRGNGQWRDRRSLEILGTGNEAEYWQSQPVAFAPGKLYRFSMRVRRGGAGGSVIAGPAFANRDYADVTDRMQERSHCFWTPEHAAENHLRLGLWEGKGAAQFEDIRVAPVLPVHRAVGPLVLGEGESLRGGRYAFRASFGGEGSNYHRPLAAATAMFNSERWCFGGGNQVTYRFQLPGVTFRSAEAGASVSYYIRGNCAVEASRDGASWRPVAAQGKLGAATGRLPAELFPAETLYLRLRAATAESNFQVNELSLEAETARGAGATPDATGQTLFAEIREFSATASARPAVTVDSVTLGDGAAGGANVISVTTRNRSDVAQAIEATGEVARTASDGRPPQARRSLETVRQTVAVGATAALKIPVPLEEPGQHKTSIALSAGGASASLHLTLRVPEYYRSDYGEQLAVDEPLRGTAQLWWCDATWKVARRRAAPRATGAAATLDVARNDREAVQIVVRATKPLRGLTAQAGPLVHQNGRTTIGPEHVQLLRVHYHRIERPTDATGTRDLWPDALPPLAKPIDLATGENQPLWLLVRVPADAAPGDYAGRVSLRAEGWSAEAPIRLHVWDFALPARNRLETAFGFTPEWAFTYHNVKSEADKRRVLDLYFRSFAEHRISPYDPTPLDPIRVEFKPNAAPPRAEIDFRGFDAAMAEAVRKYHFTGFSLPMQGMGGGTFHSRVEPSLAGFGEHTPQFKAMFASYARQVEEHLRAKGWLSMAYVYWFDEPEPKDYAFVRAGMSRIKQAAPGIRRMLTEEPGDEGLSGAVDIWCPISNAYHHEAAEKRRARGERFWWYVCCGPRAPYCTLFIDHPATELRVWLWQTWQRKIAGNLIWATNWWTSPTAFPDSYQNPYEDPMSYTDGYGLPRGTRAYWGNGDGRFIYPPESAATPGHNGGRPIFDPPVSSIRWEMLREGVEDYEYLAQLREALSARLGDAARPPLAAADRKRIESFLDVPEAITRDATTFTTDPAPIYARRAEIARAIEELSR